MDIQKILEDLMIFISAIVASLLLWCTLNMDKFLR